MNEAASPPRVSVLCITYNHGKYIHRALDSFLSQRIAGEIEIIIHDDASTDNTVKIIKEYQRLHPGIITLMTEEENQFSKGSLAFMETVYSTARGKYLAWCEGDDYWLDPHKLRSQVEYMEEHPKATVCFHPVKVLYDDKKYTPSLYPHFDGTKFTLERLLRENFIQTNSVMYRRQIDYHNQVPANILPLDWYMHIFHAMSGDIGFIDKPMAVYRKHQGSVWWRTKTSEIAFWQKQLDPHMRMHEQVVELVKGDKKLEVAALHSALQNSTEFYEAMGRHNALKEAGSFAREYTDFNTHLIWSNLETIKKQNAQIDKLNQDLHKRGMEAKELNGEIVRLRESLQSIRQDLKNPARWAAKRVVEAAKKAILRQPGV